MKRHKSSRGIRWGRVIAWLLVILLLVGAIGVIWKFTGGGSAEFSTFYLTYDGNDIVGDGTAVVASGSEAHFQVKRLLGSVEEDGYSVTVLTNAQNAADRFSYTVDGEDYFFRSGMDVTEAFGVKRDGDGFTITVPASMEEVIKAVYQSEQIGSAEREANDVAYFRLIVASSKQGTVQVDLKIEDFGMFTAYPSGRFELDKTNIVF